MSNKNTRISEILVDGEWQNINPIDIKQGMTFRMFEEDGTPVTWEWISSWTATSDAYYNEDGIITVNTDR